MVKFMFLFIALVITIDLVKDLVVIGRRRLGREDVPPAIRPHV
jgi:hypothetical protein